MKLPTTINIKPLSVNQAWQGKRFKTPAYKKYERDVLLMLPALEVPDGSLVLRIEAGVSNKQSDIDNVAKPFIDILQKKYGFNDCRIYQLLMFKRLVEKGKEYIHFDFYAYE